MFINIDIYISVADLDRFILYGKGRPPLIRGMQVDKYKTEDVIVPVMGLTQPSSLDFHAATQYIYFSDATSYRIGRQKLDGQNREFLITDGENSNNVFSLKVGGNFL